MEMLSARSPTGRRGFAHLVWAAAWLCSCVAVAPVRAQLTYDTPYVFTRLAGGAMGNADGKGVAAKFHYPSGVAVDAAGNAFVVDHGNCTIRRVTKAGVVTTLAGTAQQGATTDGTGAAARFYYPNAIAIDGSGNLFVSETSNHVIRRITPAGVVTTLAGEPGVSGASDGRGAAAHFNEPAGVATDADGNVYVADSRNHTIRRIAIDGTVTTVAGVAGEGATIDGAAGAARFHDPQGIAVDASGRIYVGSSHCVRRIDPDGSVSTVAGRADDTEQGVTGRDGAAGEARFAFPAALAVDRTGNIYVADFAESVVRRIEPDGTVTTLGGVPTANANSTVDGLGAAARLSGPLGLAVSAGGTLYVANENGQTVVTAVLGAPALMGGDEHVWVLVGAAIDHPVVFGGRPTAAPVAVQLPAGLAFDPATGHLTGKLLTEGTVTATFSAPNQAGTGHGSIQITAVNEPTIGPIANQSIDDSAVCVVSFDLGYSEPDQPNLRLTATSSNPALVPATAVSAGYHDHTGSVQVVPVAGKAGKATITVTADDGIATVHRSFVLTVNKRPTISHPADQTIYEGTSKSVAFTVGGGDMDAARLKVTATSSDPAVIAASGLTLGGSGAHRTITIAGMANRAGDVIITLKVSTGLSAVSTIFQVHVLPNPTPWKITTAAGKLGVRGQADGAAKSARFDLPFGLALDGAGNFYVSELNGVVRKMTREGVVSTLAGTWNTYGAVDGTGAAARFNLLRGIAVDAKGNVFVADYGNHTIRRITPAGVVTTFAGAAGQPGLKDGTGGSARFNGPDGVATDAAGNVYVADQNNARIRKITPAGKVSTWAGLHDEFVDVGAIAVDAAGTVYVTEVQRGLVWRVSRNGKATLLAGPWDGVGSPVFDGAGQTTFLAQPDGIAVDRAGVVYVSDTRHNAVRMISPEGRVTTLAGFTAGEAIGAVDGTGTKAGFWQPSGLVVDSSGALYIADYLNGAIRRGLPTPYPTGSDQTVVAAGRTIRITPTFAGQPTAFSATGLPAGLKIDARTGAISGKIATSGHYPVRVRATNAAGVLTSSLTIVAVQPPTLSALRAQTIVRDQSGPAQGFTIGDPDTAVSRLKVTATSSDLAVVPAVGIALAGSGVARSIAIKPARGRTGHATIAVTVSDGAVTTSRSFVVTIDAPPTITRVANQTLAKGHATPVLAFTVADPETAAAKLTVTALSSNAALVPPAGVVLGGTAGNRTIRITPVKTQTGSSKITVTVSDGVAKTSIAFTVTVTSGATKTGLATDLRPESLRLAARGQAVGLAVDAPAAVEDGWQWSHDFVPVPAAAGRTLTLAGAQAGDAGRYVATAVAPDGRRVGCVIDLAVSDLRISSTRIGDTLVLSGSLAVNGPVDATTLDILLPAGWRCVGLAGAARQSRDDEAALVEWTWSGEASYPHAFTAVLSTPAGSPAPEALDAMIEVRGGGGTAEIRVELPGR